jgi:hypothetical protein
MMMMMMMDRFRQKLRDSSESKPTLEGSSVFVLSRFFLLQWSSRTKKIGGR